MKKKIEDLNKDLIAHIINLSRRWPGEIVRATLENYSRVADNDEIAAVKENILTKDEKITCSDLHVLHVPGKNTCKVPCLLRELSLLHTTIKNYSCLLYTSRCV